MKITPSNLLQVTLVCLVLFLNFSCNKDSDLLAEYVVNSENEISEIPKEVSIDLAHAVFTTEEDQPVTFNLLYNTSSERKGRRRYKSSSKPKYGAITIEKDSIAVYTPPSDYNGKDDIEITLEVTNEDETTSEEVVTIDVTVEPVTDVVEDIVEVSSEEPIVIEPLKNDTFKEESEVVITEVSQPSNGTAVINEDNTITFTPNTNNTEEVAPEEVTTEEVAPEETTPAEDTFTYTTSVTNPDNTVTEETGSVTVTVTDKTPTSEEPVEMGGLKAFPGAEGFGQYATGGRGGKVLFVTNLNNSGSGSLREALEASGPRTVIFRVGGTINLSSGIVIKNPNLTIAGQTAPGGGILIKGG
ncbi:MAG: Ig-like domain-containing protein, partial [Arenibacter sp.]